MRDAINNNPRVQMIVIGVMLVLGVFLLFTTVLKKDAPPPDGGLTPAEKAAEKAGIALPTDSASATGTTVTPTPAGTTPPADTSAATTDPAAAAPTAPVTPTTPAPDASAAAADGLLPTQGLPKDVLIAYAKDKAIALLVIDPKATTDKQIRDYTEALTADDKVEVFEVKAKDIAEYSRITSGVSVSRTPALVVIRPRKLTDNVPTATVSYGFRNKKSVELALKDALYDGETLPSYP